MFLWTGITALKPVTVEVVPTDHRDSRCCRSTFLLRDLGKLLLVYMSTLNNTLDLFLQASFCFARAVGSASNLPSVLKTPHVSPPGVCSVSFSILPGNQFFSSSLFMFFWSPERLEDWTFLLVLSLESMLPPGGELVNCRGEVTSIAVGGGGGMLIRYCAESAGRVVVYLLYISF